MSDAAITPCNEEQWVASSCEIPWSRHQEYLTLADKSLSDLEPIRTLGLLPHDTVPVISIVHNGARWLRDFIRHYRAIGVRRFIMVDHCSTDETSEFLLTQPDVDLYRTEASYSHAAGGQMWATGLARKFAMGRWALRVDADELLVYDGMDQYGLSELAALIERRGETRLYAPMIDMYPRGPILDEGLDPDAKLIDVAPYFDPFFSGGYTYYERSQIMGCATLLNHRRSRVFSGAAFQNEDGTPIKFTMAKFPLSKWNNKTAYCLIHFPHPLDENPSHQLAALLHFKFLGNFHKYTRSVAELGQAWNGGRDWADYADTVERRPKLSLYHTDSRFYEGPRSLIRESFIEPLTWA
jgi:hypothetical protein